MRNQQLNAPSGATPRRSSTKHRLGIIGAFLVGTLAVGGVSLAGAGTAALAAPASHGEGEVFTLKLNEFPPPPVVDDQPVEDATAKITRNSSGVTINIRTVGLDAHHAYTAWALVFNCGNTADCAFEPPVRLAGHIVGGSGNASFNGHLAAGGGFDDPMGAEFHIVIADHGHVNDVTLPGDIQTPVPPPNWRQVAIFAP